MNSILRQEWKSRTNSILITQAVLFAINLIGIISMLFNQPQRYSTPTMWFIIAVSLDSLIVFLPLITGSGNIGKVLFKDSSYLLLSIPRNGFQILGGKIIIGVAECIIYLIPAIIYVVIFMVQMLIIDNTGISFGAAKDIAVLLDLVFIKNTGFIITGFILAIVCLAIFSILISTASIFIRSFLKTKRFATVLTIVAFFFMVDIPSRIGLYINRFLPLNIDFSVTVTTMNYNQFGQPHYFTESMPITISLLPIIIWVVFAVAYFIVSSILLEKKVEV